MQARAGKDVRRSGSGNAGARNVFRSGDRTGAALTFAWDALKGALAVVIAVRLRPTGVTAAVASLAVVAGHIWPAQLEYRGGKGVATAIGCTIALAMVGRSWENLVGALLVWTLVAFAHQPVFERHRRSLGAGALSTGDHGP